MKILKALVPVLVLLVAWIGCTGETPQLGIVAKVPLSISAQLTFASRVAIESGIAVTGPAVFAVKTYLNPWELGVVSLLPTLGLGGAVAFLPGDLIAWGAYALAGVEVPIPETRLSVIGDLVIILPLPVGTGTFHIGPQIGIRLDF